MSRQVALLRGVNLGGRKVVMSELRAACESAGFTDVETLIASGNLVLGSRLKGDKLEKKLEALILEELGLKTDVHVRDAAQLDAIIAANPFKAFAKSNPNFLVVYFMRTKASAAEMEAMEKTALTGEEVKQGANCLYIKFPNGQGVSKLKLPKVGTARNWNTVTKLAAMAADA
ncbi:MAG: DUF1697 domain-containing protein [Proteobacteria bacterium]|nr:DUF1697 domain-containing protein [Pseudomonadota bacterium]